VRLSPSKTTVNEADRIQGALPERPNWKNRREIRLNVERERARSSLFRDDLSVGVPYRITQAEHPEITRAYVAARKRHKDLVRNGVVPHQPFISRAEISRIFREQQERCALTRRPFLGGIRTSERFTLPGCPSLDRKNTALGYVSGNVRLVIFEANRARGDGTDADLCGLAADVLRCFGYQVREPKEAALPRRCTTFQLVQT
jgi:hypothetical protein